MTHSTMSVKNKTRRKIHILKNRYGCESVDEFLNDLIDGDISISEPVKLDDNDG